MIGKKQEKNQEEKQEGKQENNLKNNPESPVSQSEAKKSDHKSGNKPAEVDKLAEMTDLLKRTQANFENFKKQTEARMMEINKMAGKQFLLQLLPIIDNFELALKNCDINVNQKEFCEGVKLIHAQLSALLEQNAVKIIKTEGEKFDPYLHEALMKVESELPENTIIEEFQKGYFLHGQVIRHAKVKISAGNKSASSEVKK